MDELWLVRCAEWLAAARQGVFTHIPARNCTNKGYGGANHEGARRERSSSCSSELEHSNLFVGNLSEDLTAEHLQEAFAANGKVVSCRFFHGSLRTCALVKMETIQQAAAVVEAWRNQEWAVKFAEEDLKTGRKGKGHDGKETPCNNLYVKALPAFINEAHLQAAFSKAGKVLEMKILRHGKKECAALIRMGSVEDAKKAVRMLRGTTPAWATPLALTYKDRSKDNLYVKGLPLDFTQERLEHLFGGFGTVRRCRMLPPPATAEHCAALVQMASSREAASALEALDGTVHGYEMQIRFAEKETQRPEHLSDNIYVKGLPLGTPEFVLRSVFQKFGTVMRLKVMEPRMGENLDCSALVQMSRVEEAQAAVQSLNGESLSVSLPIKLRYAGKDQVPGCNLYVTGLPVAIKEAALRATFASCGEVARLRLLSQSGRSETHALVEMMTSDQMMALGWKVLGLIPGGPGHQRAEWHSAGRSLLSAACGEVCNTASSKLH
ncbi:unnamed protein product [Effrenium voratum]|nr:unnamed protein product [Effrenium voratum]